MLVASIALADSSITPQCDADDWEAAAARVRAVAARAFDGYAEHAWGQDELRPVSNRSRDNWGGLAVTMVDSLDTLLLMGLTEHYKRARDWLVDNLPARLGTAVDVPFFEVVIRCLGGLLGAHTLSGDAALLDLAEQLGDRLLRAFVSPSGLPFCTVNLAHGNASCPRSDFGYSIPLAELGSVQLEFGALAELLDRPEIAVAADGALRALRRLPSLDGLYPSRLRPHSGGPAAKDVGFGSGVRRRHPNCSAACQHAVAGLASLAPSSHPPRPKPHRSAGRLLLRDAPQAVAPDGRHPAVAAGHAPREPARPAQPASPLAPRWPPLRRSQGGAPAAGTRPARDACSRPGHKQPAPRRPPRRPLASPLTWPRPPRAGLCAARRAAREAAASLRAELRAPLLLRPRLARSGGSLRRRGDERLRGAALRTPATPAISPAPGPSPHLQPEPSPHPDLGTPRSLRVSAAAPWPCVRRGALRASCSTPASPSTRPQTPDWALSGSATIKAPIQLPYAAVAEPGPA